jgi:hypothetical protein
VTRERAVGSTRTTPVYAIADRAARYALQFRSPRAVTMDPEGRVWVEAPQTAAESDLVGVYAPALGILELTRRIAADLKHEKELRNPVAKRRVVGRPRRKEAA